MQDLARVAIDLATGQVADAVMEPALQPAWRVLQALLFPRWSGAFAAVQLHLSEAKEARKTKDATYVAALVRSFAAGEADILVAQLLTAAAQATTEERMQMLAAAAAGVLTPDLDSEMRSRVARAVEQIEPSDVLRLRHIVEEPFRFAGTEAHLRHSLGTSYAILEATGCIRASLNEDLSERLRDAARRRSDTVEEARTEIVVTELGRAVLGAVSRWRPGDARRS